jgi:hypothetical protein
MYDWLKDLDNEGLSNAYDLHFRGRRYNKLSPLGMAVLDEVDRRLVEAHELLPNFGDGRDQAAAV